MAEYIMMVTIFLERILMGGGDGGHSFKLLYVVPLHKDLIIATIRSDAVFRTDVFLS